MNLSDLAIGSTYSFSSHARSIWPDVKEATFDGFVGYSTASKIAPVAAQHQSALTFLPKGTSSNATQLRYAIFIANGIELVMAVDWINTSTIREVTAKRAVVEIAGVSVSDYNRIRAVLNAAGFVVTSMTG